MVNDTRNNTSWTSSTRPNKQLVVWGGAGDTKNDDQEDLGEEVDRREVLVRATYDTRRQKFDEKNRCDMVEGVGQKEAKGAGFWGQGTTQSRRERTP